MRGMNKCLVWNVRGLNRPQKQREVYNFLCKNKIGIAYLVETKLKNERFADLYTNVFQDWHVTSNFAVCKGGRILVVWLGSCFEVDVILAMDQCVHLKVKNLALHQSFFCSFVYAFNEHSK